MRRGKTAGVVALFTLSVLVVAACGDAQNAETRAAIAEGCAIDSECSSPLVCAFRACHVECETARDCEKYGKANCVQSDKPYRVCQLPTEERCKLNSDCPGQQICALDAKCRDACLVDRDCGNGQLCVSRVCAEKEELIEDKLPGAPPPAKGDACLRPSDCGADLVCKFGTCTVECVTAKDCDYGLSCIDTRCGVLNVGGGGGAGGGGGSAGAAGMAGQGGIAGQPSSGGMAGQGGAGGQIGGAGGQIGGAGQAGSGQAGVGGKAGAGGGTCVQDAPCDTGNACETGKTDCSTGLASCIRASTRPAGTVCRAAAGVCDTTETCDGTTPTCPPDSRKSAGTECRAAAGACDAAEVCDGGTVDCPVDALRPSNFACRTSLGDCDAEEICSGTDPQCPPDARVSAGSVCRASTGDCDAAEVCDGAATACPDDALRSAGETCRAAASACDVAETCSGASNSCPIDGFLAIGNACTGGFCDGLGACSTTCTPNAPCSTGNPCELGTTDCGSGVPKCVATGPGNAGTVCRAAAGPCDVEDVCSGTSTTCADEKVAAGATCRPSAGPCDPVEICDGSAVACPDDVFDPATKVCRAAAGGGCDVAETCTGSTAACPANVFAPATKVCRASAGFCDVAESCTGSSAACPSDALKPATLECRPSAGVCDPAENCTGTTAICPADALSGSDVVCRPAANDCDVPESCGGTPTCPPNGFQDVGTTCPAGECDVTGVCAIARDCKHRWRVATPITGQHSLSSSIKTAVVAGGSVSIGPAGVGYDATSGAEVFVEKNMGAFAGRGGTRYGIFLNASANATQSIVVHDLSSGTSVTKLTHGPSKNYQANLNRSATSQTASQSLVVASANAAAVWSTNASGKDIAGQGPGAMLVAHAPDGSYQQHLQYADTPFEVTPTALFDGRWAIPIATPPSLLKFPSHSVPAGTNEILVLKKDLSFDHAHVLDFAPNYLAVLPSSNLRILSDGGARIAAYTDTGAVWSRNDCGGQYLGTSSKDIIVAQNVVSTLDFCGRPVPADQGNGMGVAVLEAGTGKTLSIYWFPTSRPASLGTVSISGDPYFLYPADTLVCGQNNASISVLAY